MSEFINSLIVDSLFPTQKSASIFDSLVAPKGIGKSIFELLTDIQNIKGFYIQWSQNISEYNSRGQVRENPYVGYLQYPNKQIKELSYEIVKPTDSNDVKMEKIQAWVVENLKYQLDEEQYGVPEYWALPTESLKRGKGDCIANYEEVYVRGGLKRVGDLKTGDEVLSYDFVKGEFCYKKIIKIWEKGRKKVKRVSLKNGQHVDVTEDHPMWVRMNQQGKSKYEKTYLKDIDLTRWWKRKLPTAVKIPYEVADVEELPEDLCYALGYSIAEGWNTGKVQTSGYKLPKVFCPIFEKYKIPFSMGKNNSGVPVLNFLKSPFKDLLRSILVDSFNINLPEWFFHLPENKLKAFLEGYFQGDGHNSKYPDKRGYQSNKERVYSTSCERFARDLCRISLQIGKPLYLWKQEDHQGFGDEPIYRLSFNTMSFFLRDHGYDGLSEVSIKQIEDLGETEIRDFEVEDTHTFFFKNGLCCHQCEDGAFLIHSLALAAGVPAERLRTYGGFVESGQGADSGQPYTGHGWTAYKRETDNEWVVIDSSYYPNPEVPVAEKPLMKKDTRYYDDFWYFNIVEHADAQYNNFIRNPEKSQRLVNIYV